jgi:hypothetical protein
MTGRLPGLHRRARSHVAFAPDVGRQAGSPSDGS